MPIDYKRYPPDWKQRRERVLEREEHKCKFCGIPNYSIGYRDNKDTWNEIPEGHVGESEAEFAKADGYKIIKIILTIAHLDHDEENWEVKDERLAALCQRCHLRYDIPEKLRRRKKKKYANSLFPIQ